MTKTSNTCMQIRDERLNHIKAIEVMLIKKIYTKDMQFLFSKFFYF